MKALLTRKLGMTSLISEDGSTVSVTLLTAKANTITQIKNLEKDGYNAVQLGFEEKKNGKAQTGHLRAAKTSAKAMREFSIIDDELPNLNIGDQINADIFEVGEHVNVTGVSKGKGFAGTIKRHGF